MFDVEENSGNQVEETVRVERLKSTEKKVMIKSEREERERERECVKEVKIKVRINYWTMKTTTEI